MNMKSWMRTNVKMVAGTLAVGLLVCSPVAGAAANSSDSEDATPQRRPALVDENLRYAKSHSGKGNVEEAAQIYQVVLLAEPDNGVAREALAKMAQDAMNAHQALPFNTDIVRPGLLGTNLCRRPVSEGLGWRIGLYPVNRVLDFLDVFSFHVGVGGGAFVDLHMTHAM